MTTSKSGTLVANVVSTVTLSGDFSAVEVVNRNGLGEIWILVDSGATDPTVAGDNHDLATAGTGAANIAASPTAGATQVKMISTAACTYYVRGVVDQ